jgi:septal ring factor EnvC (AmiA/AmiB activator)
MELKQLAEQLNTASAEIKNAQDKLATELKTVGAESAETKSALAKAQANFDELKGLFGKMDEKLIELEQKAKRPGFGQMEEAASLGEAADNFTRFAEEAMRETIRELQELRREQASSIVLPGNERAAIPGGLAGPGGLKLR